MSAVDKIHNLSLRLLTLCGFGVLICLAANIVTALVMLISDICEKKQCRPVE